MVTLEHTACFVPTFLYGYCHYIHYYGSIGGVTVSIVAFGRCDPGSILGVGICTGQRFP